MSEKYQTEILRLSNSNSVASFKMKFGKIFSWVCGRFFKKVTQKSGILIETG